MAAGNHAGIHAVGTAGSLHVNVMWTCIYIYIYTYILRNVIFICIMYIYIYIHIDNTVYVYNLMCQYVSYIQL